MVGLAALAVSSDQLLLGRIALLLLLCVLSTLVTIQEAHDD